MVETREVVIAEPKLKSSEEVAAQLGLCVRSLQRLVRDGEFPQPIRFSRKLIRWSSATVNDWIQTRSIAS